MSEELPNILFNYAIKDGVRGRVINALPFFGSFGGPVFKEIKDQEQINDFLEKIIYENDPLSFLFVENPFYPIDASCFPFFNECDRRIFQYTNLSDPIKDLFERIDSSTRRNIKKAIRNEIIVSSDDPDDSMNMIWHLENMTSKKVKTKPENFYHIVKKHFNYYDDYLIYYAYLKGQKIASLLLFYCADTVEYFVPSYDPAYLNLEPMALLIYTAMQEAKERGMKFWSWGGISETAHTVHKYKRKWDSNELYYRYFIYLDPKRRDQLTQEVLDLYPYFYVYPISR
jgi:lipid II:glycine glycyltransferase (peptidoglycan interpeptide bridge formation enzyme)